MAICLVGYSTIDSFVDFVILWRISEHDEAVKVQGGVVNGDVVDILGLAFVLRRDKSE